MFLDKAGYLFVLYLVFLHLCFFVLQTLLMVFDSIYVSYHYFANLLFTFKQIRREVNNDARMFGMVNLKARMD